MRKLHQRKKKNRSMKALTNRTKGFIFPIVRGDCWAAQLSQDNLLLRLLVENYENHLC